VEADCHGVTAVALDDVALLLLLLLVPVIPSLSREVRVEESIEIGAGAL
jgi:hypothetical protein